MKKKTSEKKVKSASSWDERNREYRRIRDYRRKGIRYIRENSDLEDLDEYEEEIKNRRLILARRKLLNKGQ